MNARRISFRTAAASAALGAALLFAAQSFAADTTTSAPADQSQAAPQNATTNDQSAQPGQAQSTQAPAPKLAKTNHEDRVEARLKQLHAQLHITQAQDPQWQAYAQVLRDNAAAMDQSAEQLNDINKQRATQTKMSAVDDLKSYEQYADAHADISQKHADGLKKLVPAFEALYATFSDHQKRITDRMFEQARRMHEAKEAHKQT